MKLAAVHVGALGSRERLRALVVVKKTPLTEAIERNDEHLLSLVSACDPSVARMVPSHIENEQSLQAVLGVLAQLDIEYTVVRGDELGHLPGIEKRFDMVIAIGGDGTVLDASHVTSRVPILGVNSAPDTSRGHFCVSNRDTFAAVLDDVLSGRRQPLKLMRLRAFIDGKPVGRPALNEVFVEDTSGTSHYTIEINGVQEEQASDGMFIATASGSTAWMRPYGSLIMPVQDRSIQYLTRGPIIYPGQSFRLLSGFVPANGEVLITSKMREGTIAIDGRRNRFDFPRGSRLVIKRARRDLRLFVDADCNSRYHGTQAVRRDTGPRH